MHTQFSTKCVEHFRSLVSLQSTQKRPALTLQGNHGIENIICILTNHNKFVISSSHCLADLCRKIYIAFPVITGKGFHSPCKEKE